MTPPPPLRPRTRASGSLTGRLRVAIVALALIGGLVLAIPTASEWFSTSSRSDAIARYAEHVDEADAAERRAAVESARSYNRELRDSPLSDPYIGNATGAGTDEDRDAAYDAELSISGGAPMARLQMPTLGIDLPVYHDTDEATLAHGVGHLRESSLPVGGSGSHAVLTAHNGFTGAEMFDDLERAQIGDTFTVTVMGEQREYRVDAINVVKPDQLEALHQVPGQDYVTLVTCTPRYINSDRLLVRGTFTGSTQQAAPHGQLGDPAPGAGFPWWVVTVAVPPLVVLAVLKVWFAPAQPPHRTSLDRNGRSLP